MDSALLFAVKLDWLQGEYPQLRQIAIHPTPQSLGEGKCLWIFPMKHYDKVVSLLGKPVEFPEDQVNEALKHSPNIKEEVRMERWKGKGEYRIEELPNEYIVYEFQKIEKLKDDDEHGFPQYKIKESAYHVPKELVMKVWSVVKKQPLNKKVKGATVQENTMKLLGITRFNRDDGTGTFNKREFFGTRTTAYRRYYLHPVHILKHEGVIKFYLKGLVEKIQEEWEPKQNRRMSDDE